MCHAGRTVPAHVQSALEERDPTCVVPGCDVAQGLAEPPLGRGLRGRARRPPWRWPGCVTGTTTSSPTRATTSRVGPGPGRCGHRPAAAASRPGRRFPTPADTAAAPPAARRGQSEEPNRRMALIARSHAARWSRTGLPCRRRRPGACPFPPGVGGRCRTGPRPGCRDREPREEGRTTPARSPGRAWSAGPRRSSGPRARGTGPGTNPRWTRSADCIAPVYLKFTFRSRLGNLRFGSEKSGLRPVIGAEQERTSALHPRVTRTGGHAGDLMGAAGTETVVYTDGSCLGNPGPGGWAWAVPDGPFASGAEPAVDQPADGDHRRGPGPRGDRRAPCTSCSDSTYVVNCFRDRWWEGWQRRGWRNSAGKPVANRDLWEPLLELALDPARAGALLLGEGAFR